MFINNISKANSIINYKAVKTPKIKSEDNEKYKYTDDGIFGYDGYWADSKINEIIRANILSKTLCASKSADTTPNEVEVQLSTSSKYYNLGMPVLSSRSGIQSNICTNLQDMPDFDGVRGKTPLAGKKENVLWRMNKVKKSGIKTIIDLRSNGEVSKNALEVLNKLNIKYINFPIECNFCDKATLEKISGFINAINEKDYYMGCANGEMRTDLAVALNYLVNPQAQNAPQLYYKQNTPQRAITLGSLRKYLKLIQENPEIVTTWGYRDYSEFINLADKKLQILLRAQ